MIKDIKYITIILVSFFVCATITDAVHTLAEVQPCKRESNEPKDSRPKIPDCGLSTWDEIRGECNERD